MSNARTDESAFSQGLPGIVSARRSRRGVCYFVLVSFVAAFMMIGPSGWADARLVCQWLGVKEVKSKGKKSLVCRLSVTNSGDAPAGPFSVRVSRSADLTLGSADTVVKSFTVKRLKPGKTRALRFVLRGSRSNTYLIAKAGEGDPVRTWIGNGAETPILISISKIPTYGTEEDLAGRTSGVTPSDNAVCVYVKVNGAWWGPKPSYGSLVSIGNDGSWTCDITTGGDDIHSTDMAAYLVPWYFEPPSVSGEAELPASLESCLAKCYATRPASINITKVPECGTQQDVAGNVTGVTSYEAAVCVYVQVDGKWWGAKPQFGNTVPVASDGSWTCDITSGGNDVYSTKISAFLVAQGFIPPDVKGEDTLPQSLTASALACVTKERCAAPEIEITTVPEYGTDQDVKGVVTGISPSEAAVCVYIFTNANWWGPKPAWDQTIPINDDGTWSADITTGGDDIYATTITAFLVRKGFVPPRAEWACALPIMSPEPLAQVSVGRGPQERVVQFAGYDWRVKSSLGQVPPGDNYFSDSLENVFIDGAGLHLRAAKDANDHWQCAEIIMNRSLGYGTYLFYTSGRLDLLSPSTVAGLYTFDCTAADLDYRELDFEFSKFGNAADATNAQYAVQPWSTSGNVRRYTVDLCAQQDLTLAMAWGEGSVTFVTLKGHLQPNEIATGEVVDIWEYTGPDLHSPGHENPRVNLWFFNGVAPPSGNPEELVLSDFKFFPPSVPVPLPPLDSVQKILQFKDQPESITTNLARYAVAGYYPSATSVTLNGVPVELSSGGFLQTADLALGENNFSLQAMNGNTVMDKTSKTVNYDPAFRTDTKKLLYVRAESAAGDSVVIDLDGKHLLGVMNPIVATSTSGRFIVDTSHNVYSTKTHQCVGLLPLPGTYPVFNSTDTFCYSGSEKAAFVEREPGPAADCNSLYSSDPATNVLSIDSRYSRIYPDNQLITVSGYPRAVYTVNLLGNTASELTTFTVTNAYFTSFASDASKHYGFATSYGWASGNVDIINLTTGEETSLGGFSDYVGQVAFTIDGKYALVGSYGNSYYGGGGINTVDIAARTKTETLTQFGASSVVVGADGLAYSTSRYCDSQGSPDRRGADVYSVSNGKLNLLRSFFLNLPHQYVTDPAIILKQ